MSANWAYNSDTISRTFINLLAAPSAQATPLSATKRAKSTLEPDVSLGATLAGGTSLCTEGDLIQSGPVWCGGQHFKLNSIYKALYININGKPVWQKKVQNHLNVRTIMFAAVWK